MVTCKCIRKYRNKKDGTIYGYMLQDIHGNTERIGPKELKDAIKAGKIKVVNLTLTSDNRLIDSKGEKNINEVVTSNKIQKKPSEDRAEKYLDMLESILKPVAKEIGGNLSFVTSEDGPNWTYSAILYEIFGAIKDKGTDEYSIVFDIRFDDEEKYVFFGVIKQDGDTALHITKNLEENFYSKKNIETYKEIAQEFVRRFKNKEYLNPYCPSSKGETIGMSTIEGIQDLAYKRLVDALESVVKVEESTGVGPRESLRSNEKEFARQYNLRVMGRINISMLVHVMCNLNMKKVNSIECTIKAQDIKEKLSTLYDDKGMVHYRFGMGKTTNRDELVQLFNTILKRADKAIVMKGGY